MPSPLRAAGSAFLSPGEVLDRVVKAYPRGFRPRGYRVIYWRPGVSLSELEAYFATDQQQAAADFARLMHSQGFTAERYLVEFQPVSLTWSSGRCTDTFERRFVLLEALTQAPPESLRQRVEFPGGSA